MRGRAPAATPGSPAWRQDRARRHPLAAHVSPAPAQRACVPRLPPLLGSASPDSRPASAAAQADKPLVQVHLVGVAHAVQRVVHVFAQDDDLFRRRPWGGQRLCA